MDRPDILLILLDDFGWADLGCMGSTFHETPHLDRLAAEGMLFTDAYAASPVCSPTRASLMTGRYPSRVGITQFIGGHAVGRLRDVPYFPRLPADEYAVARALRDGAGYQTWHVGKWHLGGRGSLPTDHGFEVNRGGADWGMPVHGYFSPWRIPGYEDGVEGEYLTDRLTDDAIRLIREADDRPFFLNLWHYTVHVPIQAPAPLVEKYRRKADDLGLAERDPFAEGEPFPCHHKRLQRVRRRRFQSDAAYAAMVENLDTNVGRLLAALAESGRAERTLVLFSSDNGGLATAEGSPTCNAPLAEGKGWMQEGGIREPLLARWPARIRPGTTCGEPVTSPDFYPTLLEAAGLDPLPWQHVDGRSFLAALEGRPQERGTIFCHYPHYSNQGGGPASMVRCGPWKLVETYETGRRELYHLGEDIGETTDRAEAQPDLVRELAGELERLRRDTGALVPVPNSGWEWWMGEVPGAPA